MRVSLLILAGLTLGSSAFAQAPSSTASASVDPAPPIHFDMIRPSLALEACQREARCGCSDGVEACTINLGKAQLPAGTLACLAFQPCEVYCETKDAGQPGTQLHAACLTPEAQATAETRFRTGTIRANCEAHRKCGCEELSVDACAAKSDKALNNVKGEFFACMMQQPCSSLCDPKTAEPGGGVNTQCMQPAMAAHKAQTAPTQSTLLKLQMMQKDHALKMSIIRSMGGSGQRYRVYDASGRYLRTE